MVTEAQADLRAAVLWLAIEDFSGLWEVEWELRSRGVPEHELRQRARRLVLELLRSGELEVFECQEPYGDLRRIEGQLAVHAVLSESSWDEPDCDAKSIRIGATPEGEDAYHTMTEVSVRRPGNGNC